MAEARGHEPSRRRSTPRRASPAPTTRTGNLLRSTQWAGLWPGDRVEVAGLKIRGATFTFVAHVRNLATGDESVEVVGGRAGERKLRSFRPEQVYPWSARRTAKRAVSLADAPQLPLG